MSIITTSDTDKKPPQSNTQEEVYNELLSKTPPKILIHCDVFKPSITSPIGVIGGNKIVMITDKGIIHLFEKDKKAAIGSDSTKLFRNINEAVEWLKEGIK